MEPRERISIQVLPAHKQAVERMAQREGEAVSVVVRRLIVAEAKRRGLWPPTAQSLTEREAA
jgi:hypothetical protein